MKKYKDIIIGAIIAVVLLIIAVVLSLIIVGSDIPSKASNDGWLSFIGSITGSFIAVFSSVVVMYINRKEMIKMQKNQIREKRTGEIASVREKLLEMFHSWFMSNFKSLPSQMDLSIKQNGILEFFDG